VVRHPVGWLPSGRPVLALGDAAITHDPLGAQGANGATIAAALYAERIDEHEGRFDEDWMRATFQRYWEVHGAAAVAFSNALVAMPPPPHLLDVVAAACRSRAVASSLAWAFADPAAAAVLADPVATAAWLATVAADS
jgi:2-polyprenyl-6-methoxyphenol hydroxylase-like FAD-dependent oxidoreductase